MADAGGDVISEDHDSWAKKTKTSLDHVRELRSKLLQDREISEKQIAEPEAYLAAITSDKDKIRKAQDKLKKRGAKQQSLRSDLHTALEHSTIDIFDVGQCVNAIQRTSTSVGIALGVAEKRLEIRKKRPVGETIRDALQDALENERQYLKEAQESLAGLYRSGNTALVELKEQQQKMLDKRLNFAADKEGQARSFLQQTNELENEAPKYCRAANRAISAVRSKTEEAHAKSNACLKKRIAEVLALKKELEVEIAETKAALTNSRHTLERMEKNLRDYDNMPENSLADCTCGTDYFPNSPTLSKVRFKIKSSAYVGSGARSLEVVFNRFDKDKSGELDETEVRMALRRILRITHEEITDAEIHLFFTLLDRDRSGFVSIVELVAFLQANTDAKGLRDQIAIMKDNIKNLTACLERLEQDHRAKTVAWWVDDSLTKVTPAKVSDDHHKAEKSSGAATPLQRKKAAILDDQAKETIRSKMRSAAYSVYAGRELEVLFGRFAKDRSKELDDDGLRKAIRGALRIPVSVMPDQDIVSLRGMLDTENVGAVTVSQIVTFIGVDHMKPKPSAKPGRTPRLTPRIAEPTNGSTGINETYPPQHKAIASTAPTSTPTLDWQDVRAPWSEKVLAEARGPSPDRLSKSQLISEDEYARGPPLPPKTVEKIRTKMKAAAYALQCTGTPIARCNKAMGGQLEIAFARFNKEHMGKLDDDEVRRAVRRILRIPPSVISDVEIRSLCGLLDPDNTGNIAGKDIVAFIGPEPAMAASKSRSHDLPSAR